MGEREKKRKGSGEARKRRRSRSREASDDVESEEERIARRKRKRRRSASEDKALLESEDSQAQLADSAGLETISSAALGIDSAAPSSSGSSKSVKELIKDLGSSSTKRREGAAHFLGKLGEKAKPAVPSLAELLSDDEERVRLRAARAIGKIGPAAAAAVPALILTLQDGSQDRSRDDKSLAGVAVRALKRIGAAAWPGLLAALDDKALRRRSARVLRSIEPDATDRETTQAVDDLLDPGRERAAQAALAVLAKHGSEGVRLVLRVAAADDAPELQERAQEVLVELGREAVKPLGKALADDDPDLRIAAARGLGEIAREVSQRAVSKVVSKLAQALTDEDAGVRAQAVDALTSLSEFPERVEGPLIDALGDKDPRVGLAAVMGLLDVTQDREALAKRMIEVVSRGKKDYVRVGACMVLMHLGQDARESVPTLVEAIEDASTEVREYAHLALQSIRTPSMRVEVIRTASLRLQVLDGDEGSAEEDDDRPRAPRRRKAGRRRPGIPRARKPRKRR